MTVCPFPEQPIPGVPSCSNLNPFISTVIGLNPVVYYKGFVSPPFANETNLWNASCTVKFMKTTSRSSLQEAIPNEGMGKC
jgi:hypothetical protein